jgi:hypothetical protein
MIIPMTHVRDEVVGFAAHHLLNSRNNRYKQKLAAH